MPGESNSQSMTWLFFALMTVASWGVYGIFLHKGQMQMGDPENGRYKAFLFVGVAYFLTAVVAPLVVLVMNGSDWNFPSGGVWWSLFAGIVGAIGAFCVLLAFGAAPKPTVRYVPVVMSIIFAGAPIVNAVVSVTLAKDWAHVKPAFLLGILLAAAGGFLVTIYKPAGDPPSQVEQAEPAPISVIETSNDPTQS